MNDNEKLSTQSINCVLHKGFWTFIKDAKLHYMSPSEINSASMSPIIISMEKMLDSLIKEKNWSCKQINLIYSENYFPKPDIKLSFERMDYNGVLFRIEEINTKCFIAGQMVWACHAMCLGQNSIFVRIFEN